MLVLVVCAGSAGALALSLVAPVLVTGDWWPGALALLLKTRLHQLVLFAGAFSSLALLLVMLVLVFVKTFSTARTSIGGTRPREIPTQPNPAPLRQLAAPTTSVGIPKKTIVPRFNRFPCARSRMIRRRPTTNAISTPATKAIASHP